MNDGLEIVETENGSQGKKRRQSKEIREIRYDRMFINVSSFTVTHGEDRISLH